MKHEVKIEDYEKKVIIFLDILGIGNFTERSTDNKLVEIYQKLEYLCSQLSIEKLLNINDLQRTYVIDTAPERVKYSISILSDTVIISFSRQYILMLPVFLRIPRILQIYLLGNGMLTRGVAIYDKIYHKNDRAVIFGKGLVKAYNLERRQSLPQITINDKLWKVYEGDIKKLPNSLKTKLNATGNLELLQTCVTQYKEDFFQTEEGEVIFNHYYDSEYIIEELLKSNANNVLKKINRSIEYHKDKLKKRNLSIEDKKELEKIISYWKYSKRMFKQYAVQV